MTSNVFKITLPAFALMLAITASLAFIPVAEDALLQSYYQNPDENSCIHLGVNDSICQETFIANGFCAVFLIIPGQSVVKRLYLRDTSRPFTPCNITLYKTTL